MSDTTDTLGWFYKSDAYRKEIGGHNFQIVEWKDEFALMVGIGGRQHVLHIATRPTLRECQILAHDTARLWSGSDE